MATAQQLSEKGLAKVNLKTSIVCLIAALLSGISLAQAPSEGIRWAPDLVAAREAAAKFSVPLMVHFYGDACLPCRTLEQRVYSQPEVIGTLNRYFICVAINGTQRQDLAREFQVLSWPTDIFLAPDGEPLFRGVSPQDPREYLGVLTNVAVMNRDRNTLLAARKTENSSTASAFGQNGSSPHPGLQASAHPELASLPALGASATSNVTTPNFYSSSPDQMPQHQLSSSVSPRKDVQSGPAIPALQPHGISGPTAVAQTQLAQSQSTQSQSAQSQPAQGLPSQAQPAHPSHSTGDSANQLLPTLSGQAPSQFPPLPGLEVTRPIQPGQEHQHRLANAQGMPRLESNDASVPRATRTEQPQSPAPVNSGPFQLTASATSLIQDNPYSMPKLDSTHQTVPEKADEANHLGSGVQSATSLVESDDHLSPESPNLDGYCPVALRDKQWQPGSSQYAVKHLGKIYWLSSEAAAQAFLSQPDQYAPTLSGYDPQVLLYEGKLVPGSTQHGLFEQNTGQVLLFSSSESKNLFQRNFEKNMNALSSVRNRAADRRSAANP